MLTQALIPAAGRGIRAFPKTQYLPKPLLEIDGKTLLQCNIEILRDELRIHDITVIIGYEGEQIVSRFGSGVSLGVSLRYLKCDEPDIGHRRSMGRVLSHCFRPRRGAAGRQRRRSIATTESRITMDASLAPYRAGLFVGHRSVAGASNHS